MRCVTTSPSAASASSAETGSSQQAATTNTPATIADLQRSMVRGDLSSERLVELALAAIQRLASLNAFISVNREGAAQQAKRLDDMRRRGTVLGPLHGIPIAVKDNIHVAGLPNTAGTPLLRSFVPEHDAPAIARLQAAGAIVLGKTNMHELAFGITGINPTFGAVGNAQDRLCIAGGSSGGTAVAVAAGMAVAGLGTDTGGSTRIPAALNGIVGFRPTGDRYPAAGLTRISHTRDTIGPMGRTVADVALLDGLLARCDTTLPAICLRGMRLGIPRIHFHSNLESAVSRLIEKLLGLLKDAGVELVEAELENIGTLNEKTGFPIAIFESGVVLGEYLATYQPGATLAALVDSIASADVKTIMRMVVERQFDERLYREALDRYRPQLRATYAACFKKHGLDAVLFPTTPLTARPIEEAMDSVRLNGKSVPVFATYIRNTDPGSNANLPGLSIPMTVPAGDLPAGVEIDGPEGSDRRLLAIGAAIEDLIRRHMAVD